MIVALAQTSLTLRIEDNLQAIERWTKAAKGYGAEIIAFPECALTGYVQDFSTLTANILGPALTRAQAIARTYDLVMLLGTPVFSGGWLYNAAMVVLKNQDPLFYYKQELTDFDRLYFSPGRSTLTFQVGGKRCGVMICRDQNSADLALGYRCTGIEVVFLLAAHYYPSDEAKRKADKNRALPISRAIDTAAYVCKVNPVGCQSRLVSLGGSIIVDPEGFVLAEAGWEEETLLVVDLPEA